MSALYNLRLASKLTLIFVAFGLVLSALISVLAYVSGRAALQAAVESDLTSRAVEKEATLDSWVERKRIHIASLAASPPIVVEALALIIAAPGSELAQSAHDRLVADLSPWIGEQREFTDLMVIEVPSGKVVSATEASEEDKFREDRLYFIHGQRAPYVQNVYHSITLQGPAMTAAAPLVTEDGRVFGVLAGRLNLEEIEAIVNRRTGLQRTDDALLVNSAKLLITQPRFISNAAVLRLGIHSEIVNRCVMRQSGIIAADDYRGVPVLAIYRWLAEHELCLVVKLDQAEAYAPIGTFRNTLLFVNGLILLVSLTVAIALARTITQPLAALQTGVMRIGQGELDLRLPESASDEFGLLAREFNHMAAALSEQQQRVLQRTAQLEDTNRELEAFSYTVSHDLRAPLRAIDGFSRILLEEYTAQLPERGQRYLRLVSENAQQMGQLISDLLNFSRLSRQPINKRQIKPADLVRQVLDESKAEQAGRQVEVSIGDLPVCQADPGLLKQVIANLIGNALKYTHQQEVAKIEIGCQTEAGKAVYFIKDNGVGFDNRYAHKLFGVFQRLHRAEEYEGTGVGLAIVQRIIHRHGGRVWAESEVNQGATFYFTLEEGNSYD